MLKDAIGQLQREQRKPKPLGLYGRESLMQPTLEWVLPGVLSKEATARYFRKQNLILLNTLPPLTVRRRLEDYVRYYNMLVLHELSHWAGAMHSEDWTRVWWDWYLYTAARTQIRCLQKPLALLNDEDEADDS